MKIRIWPRRPWLRVLLVALALVLVPYGCNRLLSPWSRVALHTSPHDARTESSPATLRVACYNIAHGRGLANSNWQGGNREERIERLDRISDLLRQIDADVVVLNEVDFDCTWSHGVNQARHLAEKAGYPFRAEERNFDLRVLLWKLRFGNAILSRYPISSADVVDFPGYSRWETALAGKKRGISCDIQCGDRTVRVIGAHLSHRSEALRVASAGVLIDITRNSSNPVIVAGDLNSTPPDFPDTGAADDGSNALSTLDSSELFLRHPLTPPGTDGLTFHAARPKSVIDWILIPRDWRFESYQVELSELSDHRPVWVEITSR